MQLGIHLPHVGRKAGPAAIRQAAEQAEALGFADVWASEHIIVPKGAPYPPSPLFFDPLLTLAWAAAFTARVRLGTSVLVLPMRHPVPLAKELATLQLLSGGRLILGAGVGWLQAEYAALGVPFGERGRRMDEGLKLMRALWQDDPITFETTWIEAEIANMRMQPKPEPAIPVWIGGTSEAALRRAIALGDGWHGTQLEPDAVGPIVRRLKAARPNLVTSMRVGWDGREDAALAQRLAAYAASGLDHVMVEPWERELDGWLRAVERIARAGGLKA